MRTRHHAVAALALVAIIATPVLAGPMGSPHEPLAFVAVPLPSDRPSMGPIHRAPDLDIVDRPVPVPTMSSHPRIVIPPRAPQVSQLVGGTGGSTGRVRGIEGQASWYCGNGSRCTRGYPGGLYAAIRRDLLGHRGDRARVCSGHRCVVVTIIDCNCGAGANLIDLYADAFGRLAPLSRGRIPVTLEWIP
jgi:hypothetical protein